MSKNKNQNLDDYNKIFEKLSSTGEELDIYDMVAYGIYKKSKRIYITNHKKENGKNPTEKELKIYVSGAETHLDTYKSQAERMIEELFNTILDGKLPEIENKIIKTHIKPSFGYGVLINLVSSLIWAVLLVIMYFIFSPKDYSLDKLGKEYFNKNDSIEIPR